MLEYRIPEEHHIKIVQDPAKLFTISIGLLGDLAAAINRDEITPDLLSKMKSNLAFSARFFDSYLQSKLNETLDPYLLLLGSASYYLCDSPGSALVLASKMNDHVGNLRINELYCPDLEGEGLEFLLLWLLQSDLSNYFSDTNSKFGRHIDHISYSVCRLFLTGESATLENEISQLREHAYSFGTPRQLLLCDAICAIIKKKIINSAWLCLPHYSDLPKSLWSSAIKKRSFIKELWPAQHLLGKASVLRGKSAIIQMPTSAGKTKSIEIILRSAFLADRTSLAIIIAPFRALCSEIKNSLSEAFHDELIKVNELSDALQTDFDIAELLGHQQILVVTPEKLAYVLRHAPELTTKVGLLIFDEGHQFDSGTRGITYELLLTSLRSMIPEGAQKVLISAVISNAEAVGEWLNGEPNVVKGTKLIPTFRSVGFVSWLDQLGRIEYVDSRDTEQNEFFVPRVIERFNLGRRGKEQNDRHFPEKDDG
ncbi:DEAD/DEAH box helicase [Pseudomonas sp. AN-1]|uniref:DEAD/DEAH box helicase n=1 Tax=Pseudomonas sp. AN-1 TaxID=3096605 RepID=UPI002A69EA58|nr:DEAD/DEAH box helicase [Pseudomonas sp. AN-1]WPP46505.1 DEAD/DEAH box helicase [Pseudomonas sp. AN-1]